MSIQFEEYPSNNNIYEIKATDPIQFPVGSKGIDEIQMSTEIHELSSFKESTITARTNDSNLYNIVEETITVSDFSAPVSTKPYLFKFYARASRGTIKRVFYEITDADKNPMYKLQFGQGNASFEDPNGELVFGQLQLNENAFPYRYDIGLFLSHQFYNDLSFYRSGVNTYCIQMEFKSNLLRFYWDAHKSFWILSFLADKNQIGLDALFPVATNPFVKKNPLAKFEIPKRATKLGTLQFNHVLENDFIVIFTMTISYILHYHGKKNFLEL